MLQNLSISNYALIDNASIDVDKGLTIITGETGAGKSILLGALSLIVGQRADTQVLQDKSKKCIVEASFEISRYKLHDFFQHNELDYSDTTIIRREISPTGTSRAFINDTPVNLAQLKEIGLSLIDIHSQHQTLSLNDAFYQLQIVDSCAEISELIKEYSLNFKNYIIVSKELTELVEKESQLKKDLDYFNFQFNELSEATLKENEQEQLEQELETLTNAEEIKLHLNSSLAVLNQGEVNTVSSLSSVKSTLTQIAKFNSAYQVLLERVNGCYIELKDISSEIEAAEEEVVYDQERINFVSSRIDNIYRLQKKHQVNTVKELLNIQHELESKIELITSYDSVINEKSASVNKLRLTLTQLAENLHNNRSLIIPVIEEKVKSLLHQQGMPNSEIKIELEKLSEFDRNGINKCKFMFSANKGGDLKEISKVASGGELSRLMLSIKAIVSEKKSLPTIIFDEIDTGVSGDVADKVGKIMNQMAQYMQVITITHLPQIASKGDAHLFVYKDDVEDKTTTKIKKLHKDERVQEIAKMLSTGIPGAAAIKNAKELLALA